MRLIVQLPRCYAPAGLLRDFDGGLRLPVCPLTTAGRKSLAALHRICRRLLRKGAPAGVSPGPGRAGAPEACKGAEDWAAATSVNPVRPGGEAALLKTQRANDCRLFESDGSPLDDETGRGVLPGETVVPLVCVEHVWVRPGCRGPGVRVPGAPRFLGVPRTWPGPDRPDNLGTGGLAGAPALSAGISLKVLQVIVVTERPAIPRMVAEARQGDDGFDDEWARPVPGDAHRRTRSGREAWEAGEPVAPGRDVTGADAAPKKSPRPPGGGSWVPSENDIRAALSRLRKSGARGASTDNSDC